MHQGYYQIIHRHEKEALTDFPVTNIVPDSKSTVAKRKIITYFSGKLFEIYNVVRLSTVISIYSIKKLKLLFLYK